MAFQSSLAWLTGNRMGENITVLNPCSGELIIERKTEVYLGSHNRTDFYYGLEKPYSPLVSC